MYHTGLPEPDLLSITPEVPTLFERQIAADNTSMVSNYTSWMPQVLHLFLTASILSMLSSS